MAFAQGDIRVESVRFDAGSTGTTLEGTLRGREIVDYRLGAQAGQTMIVNLTTDSSAMYFNLLAPGETEIAFFIGQIEGTSYAGRLPDSGDYTIRIYQMRSAGRRGEVANYSLDVEITSADFADGLAGGPDFWEVTADGSSSKVDLSETPTADGRAVGQLDRGTVLRNRGCRISEGRRWCSVELADDPAIHGWVLGDFLMESGYVEPRPQSDAVVPGTEFHATGKIPCARMAGQPMTSCRFGVVREGGGSGYVKVFWPAGGNRVIFFEGGTPTSFDRSQADAEARLTLEKELDLFRVRIGDQRFEIPEAVLLGG